VPVSVAVADVSGDGKPDVVVANFNANTVSVLAGNGDGTFQARVDYTTGAEPRSVAVADVSGDGKPDLVVANAGANMVSVLVATCLP
jgi:hypothetical protein